MSTDRPEGSPWLSALALLGAIALAWTIEGTSRRLPADPRQLAAPLSRPVQQGSRHRSWAWWKLVLFRTYQEIANDRLLAVAAGVVFYGLLAIFPAVTAFVSLYGMVASYDTIDRHILLLHYVLPAGGVEIVQDQIARIVAKGGTLSFGFVAGLAMALWSANAGIKAMMDALNVIEDRDEQRGLVRLNVVSLAFTLGAIVFLLLAVGAVVAFPLVMSTFGLADYTGTTTWLIRWPLLFAMIVVGIAALYRFGPSASARRRWISVGTVAAALGWIAGSALLSFYLSNFADYDATYGSLGAAIGLMMWMWLTVSVVLAGAELDSQIEQLSQPG